MNLTIPVPALKQAVSGLQHVTDRVVEHVEFRVVDSGITISVRKGEEDACFHCKEAKGEKGDPLYVSLADLKAILKNIRGDTLSIRTEGHVMSLSFVEDLWRASVDIDIPKDVPFAGPSLTPKLTPYMDFLQDFRFAVPFSSTDQTRWILNGVYFGPKGEVVATDGRRLVCRETGTKVCEVGITVPATRFLKTLGQLKDASASVGWEKDYFYMGAGPWTYKVRTRDGMFPNYRQVIPTKSDRCNTFTLSSKCVEAFSFVDGMLDRNGPSVTITKQAKGLFLKSRNVDRGRVIKVELDGFADMKEPCCVNTEYMVQALKAGFRNFWFEDSLSPIVSDMNGWKHVVMPMRVE